MRETPAAINDSTESTTIDVSAGMTVSEPTSGVDPESITTESVRAALDGKLARYKLPKHVIVVDEFPRTASGKIRKADLRARYSA